MDKATNDSRIGICAIFKNEGPYILEWLAFHRVVGIDEFFIADNDSNDKSSELLAELDRLGLIRLLKFPTPPNEAPQLPAYRTLMQKYGSAVDWVAFIDADEFLIPANSESLKGALDDILNNSKQAGAIAVNWASYGSAGKTEYDPELVIKRFERRGEKDFGVNRHYKSVVSTKAYATTDENPHLFSLHAGFEYVDTTGKVLEGDEKGIKGLSKDVCWDNLRLNHYIIKSYGEFLFKKNRGRATVKNNAGLDRNINFFHAHDVNSEHEEVSEDLITKTRAELASIKAMLAGEGVDPQVISIAPGKIPNIRVAVDQTSVSSKCLTVIGWAFADDISEIKYSLGIGGQDISFETVDRIDRPDVATHIKEAPVQCGFSLKISTGSVAVELRGAEAFLRMHTNGYVQAVSIGKLPFGEIE